MISLKASRKWRVMNVRMVAVREGEDDKDVEWEEVGASSSSWGRREEVSQVEGS
jgi:hypothetical protein